MALLYQKEGKLAIFTLNRPDAMNALNPDSMKELSEALADFRADSNLWVGIITGVGERAFCAGADIKTMLPQMRDNISELWRNPVTVMRGLELWKPLIAAVNGICLGGGLELALACDIRIAAEKAIFGLPEVGVGLIPGWGGTQRLTRAIPRAKAAEMILTGRPIDAQEAFRIGLLNKVVPAADLMPEARKMAEVILEKAPLATRAAKQAMIQGTSMSFDEGLQLEQILENTVMSTEDFVEGITAFSEKRKAAFKGK